MKPVLPSDSLEHIPNKRARFPVGLAILLCALTGSTQAGEGTAARCAPGASLPEPASFSPGAVAASKDGRWLFVACSDAQCVLVLECVSGAVIRRIPVNGSPLGLVLSPDNNLLYVACAAAESTICVVDVARSAIIQTIPVGHTTGSPVLSPNGEVLAVCNRFDGDVSIIDLVERREVRRIPVMREPIASAPSPDGRHLVVAGHLPEGRANRPTAGSEVVVVDILEGRVVTRIPLRPGSGLVRGVAVSPDGSLAAVTHILAHYHWLPRMAYLGWINQNVVSLIDLDGKRLLGAVPLDDENRGAANPWAVAWTPDGGRLVITHAGTHELSVIKAAALVSKIRALPEHRTTRKAGRPLDREYYHFPIFGPATARFDLPSDFGLLEGLRTRIQVRGIGPRALALAGQTAYVASAYSDSIEVVDLSDVSRQARSIPLGTSGRQMPERQGERWFNDATLCVQGWQSCASCHDVDARCDGLNWDLLNDGPHSPKNTRSLLLSAHTPPVMALGIRDSAGTAVRAGLRHILFGNPRPEVETAIERYIHSLRPVPSPQLVRGQLSAAAERGRVVFERADVGCAGCHSAPLFTDLHAYDVGTAGDYDRPDDRFDTPSLIECWRTAPYLHDGSAATIQEVLTLRNPDDSHGRTSGLTAGERSDLVEFVLSL